MIFILAMFLLWISSKKHYQKSIQNYQDSQDKEKFGYIKLPLKRKTPTRQTAQYYFIIMLLISNDIEQNPGPKTKEINCSSCHHKTTSTNRLQCNSCNKTYHKNCIVTESTNQTDSIQWICTEKNCPPNYHKKLNHRSISSENRFSILQNTSVNSNTENVTANPTKNRKTQLNPGTDENKQLLNELPLISSEDYIGTTYCQLCKRKFRKQTKTARCIICNHETHLKCCKISTKNTEPEDITWTCFNCRKNEETITAEFDKKYCTEDQHPESWKQIQQAKSPDNDIILHFNCRSIIKKKEELIQIINNIKPAIVFLSETWMDDSCPKGMAVPTNYTIIRKDRPEKFKQKYSKKNGGGIAILIRKGVKLKIDNNYKEIENDEILCCNLFTQTSKHSITFIYRANYTDLLKCDKDGNTKMENILQRNTDEDSIIIGDLNCDTNTETPTKETQQLKTLCKEYKLKQQITQPTRISEKTATTIDHIWIRNNNLITKTGTCEGLSDHCGIYAFIDKNLGKAEPQEITYRDFRSFNEEIYRQDIVNNVKSSKFHLYLENKNLNKAFDTWLTAIKQSADDNAPIITRTKKDNSKQIPWFTKELEEITKRKNMYLKLYRLYQLPEDKEAYKAAKNHQTHLKRKNKREYYKEKINNFTGDSKKMWNILHDITDRSYKEEILPDLINEEVANKFNTFFSNVGMNVQKKLNINIDKPTLNESGLFRFQPETKKQIEHLINRIKPNVATGCDQLSAKLIKIATPVISEDLKNLVNLSYETKTFPDQLKIAIVKPIHKKGDNNDPAQYRPISILPILSKIFERSAVDQLMDYIVKNGLLNKFQHAYQKNHSTITCLFELVERIKMNMDQNNMVAMAALDLSKAFDSLAHNLILKKLVNIGLNDTATMWIDSYLKNRKQSVRLNKTISDQQNVDSGVPQGSILGPLLFIITTNDISKALEQYDISIYADDMQILVKGKDLKHMQTTLEKAIKEANKYYNENSLLCNPTKTEVILFGTEKQLNKRTLEIYVEGENETKLLKGEKHIKILGIYLDQHLNWTKQTSYVKQKATNNIRMLHRINYCLPRKQQRILYDSLVVPHFSYGDIIWMNCSQQNKNKLQLAQNFAAKSMVGAKKYDSATTALKTLQLLPLEQKRQIHLAVHVKKALEGHTTENISTMYKNQQNTNSSRAATRGDLMYPKHRLELYSRGTFYSSIKIWNSLPQNLRNNNLNNFKIELQKHLVQNFINN